MDGFIDIIIIGGVIVLIVVRIIDFLRKLAARFSAQIEQTANTTHEPYSEEREANVQSTETDTTATPKPELTYELKIARENKVRQEAKHSTEKNSTSSSKASYKKVANEAESDIRNEENEFDLRQAIIYSEIIKPKYDNEEI